MQMDSEHCSHKSAESGPEGLDSYLSQVWSKPKRTNNQCKGWKFQYTLSIDLLGEEGVTIHEKINLLTEHLQTRLGHRKPNAVHSVTVFCNFKSVLFTGVSPWIPIPIIGCVQSQSSTAHAMTEWLQDAAWLSPWRLGRPPRFLRYMSFVENTAWPWFKISVLAS